MFIPAYSFSLKSFVLPEILADIERNGPRFFKPAPAQEITALPIEFTQAAFRFGHSSGLCRDLKFLLGGTGH